MLLCGRRLFQPPCPRPSPPRQKFFTEKKKGCYLSFSSLIQRVRGTRDTFEDGIDDTSQSTERVKNHLIANARTFDYGLIETPMMEASSLFTQTLGLSSDIVSKEMYTFEDKSGNRVTLRPEGTVGVARAILAAGKHYQLPQRVFYHGSMFRYERPQRGRYREFQQFGMELIGVDDYTADIEMIVAAHHALTSLAIRPVTTLLLNTLGDTTSRSSYTTLLTTHCVTHRDLLSRDSRDRLDRGTVLRILDSKEPEDQSVIQQGPSILDSLSPSAATRFAQVCDGLTALKIPFTITPTLVRGLDYYSHTCFEFIEHLPSSSSSLRSHSKVPVKGNAVLAGGRYEGLFKAIGGPAHMGCVGWAAGLERLVSLRRSVNASSGRPDRRIAIIPIGTNTTQTTCTSTTIKEEPEMDLAIQAAAFALMTECQAVTQQCGVRFHFVHGAASLRKKMSKVIAQQCTMALFLGTTELTSATVVVKHLDLRTQVTVPRKELSMYLTKHLDVDVGANTTAFTTEGVEEN